jgi:putative spermidine/putrescine transport system substrate-binding protein
VARASTSGQEIPVESQSSTGTKEGAQVKSKLRVTIVVALVAVVAVVAAAANSSSAATTHAAKKTTITVYVSGDVNVKDLYTGTLIPGFQKAYPNDKINMIFSEHGVNDSIELGKIGAAVKRRAWPGVDIVDAGFAIQGALDGLMTPINATKIPNMAKVDKKLLTPVKGAAMPYRGSSVVLAYNTDHVASPPKTLDGLIAWIKANPAKFTYNSPNTGGSGHSFVETVLSKYVPASVQTQMVNGYVPDLESNWKQGFDVLKSLKGSIYQGVYPNGNQEVLNLLGKGQIWLAPVWSDQALSGKASGLLGANIHLTQISSPSFNGGAAYLAIPKTARSKTEVYKFANFILQSQMQVAIVNAMSGYPAVNVKYLPSSVQTKFSSLQANTLRQSYSAKMANDVNAEWQQTVP